MRRSTARRHLSRRSFLSQIGIAGAGVAALTSCAGLARQEPEVTTPKSSGGKKKAGNVSISILDRPRTTEKGRLAAYDETIRTFLGKHPRIKIDVREMLDGGEMVKTLPAKLANGTMETMFSMAPEDGSLYAARQQLALIDEQAAAWDGFEQYRGDVIEHNKDAAGKLFGLPSRGSMRGIYYSRRRFTEAGLDPDSPPLTWDEFREAAGRLTNRQKNQYGFGDVGGPSASISFLNWLYSGGGQVHVEENDKLRVRLDSPEAVSVLTMLKDMRWKDGSIAPVLYNDIGDDLMGAIATGRTAMAIHAPTGTADVRQFGGKADDFSFGPTPQNGGNAAYEASVSFCFAPNATPEQVQAAITYGTYKQFDPEAVEIRLKAMKEEGSFVPLQGDSVSVLMGDSPLRADLDAVQEKYATMSASSSRAFYEVSNTFKGFGFPLVDPATVNELIGSVMEAVMTDKNADVEELLGKLNSDTQRVFDGN
jgi:multiple sugar transport system substrate-binding protein